MFAGQAYNDMFIAWLEASYLTLALLSAVAIYAWRRRDTLAGELRAFALRPGFLLLVFGVALAGIYAQLLGQRELWIALARDDSLSEAKRLVEESRSL